MSQLGHNGYNTEPFIPTIISGRTTQAPLRRTGPHSEWRSRMEAMDVGDWFELPEKFHARITSAAVSYLKGRYTCYKHPEQDGFYIFSRTK
jgi:hypothetical protein